MAQIWTDAIAGGWTVATDMLSDYAPVLAVVVGLAIFGILFAMFSGRN